MRIRFHLEPGTGEMPSDYASRLATRACRDDLWDFCRDFGLDTQGIVNGEAVAVDGLAAFADVDAGGLLSEAFIRSESGRQFKHKGHFLLRHNLTRDRVRVCPACLTEDVESLEFRVSARPHRRSEWILEALATCQHHGMAFVDLEAEPLSGRSHDTSRALAEAVPRLPRLLSVALHRNPSRFEIFIRQLLAGGAVSQWLGQFPLYAMLGLSRVVGAVALHGPSVTLEALSGNQNWECDAVGFEILDSGERAVRDLLDTMQNAFYRSRADWGPKASYGRLYEWLAHENRDPAYEPMRRLMIEHVTETLPVGPKDRMFGRSFVQRRLHSIHSASLQFGLHPKRLRKLLIDEGIIAEATRDLSDDRVLFDASCGEPFLVTLSKTLTLKEAAAYLSVPRPLEQGLLKNGFITSVVRSGSETLKDHAFRMCDLDEFMHTIRRNVDLTTHYDPPLVEIRRASARACCNSMQIVGLLVDGTLKKVGLDPNERGFRAVLVNVAEVRSHVAGPDHGGITLRQVEKELRTSSRVVTALIDKGLIVAEKVANPVMHRLQTIILHDKLNAFREKYITLHSLAAERHVYFREMKNQLDTAGVQPVVDPKEIFVTLYRRADIP